MVPVAPSRMVWRVLRCLCKCRVQVQRVLDAEMVRVCVGLVSVGRWTRRITDAFHDLQNGVNTKVSSYITGRQLNIYNLRMDLRFRQQAVWREARGRSRPLLLFKQTVAYHNWFALPEIPVWCTCTICFARVFENVFEQKCHEEHSSVQDSRTWAEVWNWFIRQESGQELSASDCNAFVWKRGWETRDFFMYGHRTFTAPGQPIVW